MVFWILRTGAPWRDLPPDYGKWRTVHHRFHRWRGRQSGNEPNKRGLNTKVHLAVDSSDMPVRSITTEGTRADCKEAVHLIHGIDDQNLLVDRGYDTSEIVTFALSTGISVVIPPRKNRKEQRNYDRYLYKIRHLVENAFLWLKRWRGIATHYAKNATSLLRFKPDASLFG